LSSKQLYTYRIIIIFFFWLLYLEFLINDNNKNIRRYFSVVIICIYILLYVTYTIQYTFPVKWTAGTPFIEIFIKMFILVFDKLTTLYLNETSEYIEAIVNMSITICIHLQVLWYCQLQFKSEFLSAPLRWKKVCRQRIYHCY